MGVWVNTHKNLRKYPIILRLNINLCFVCFNLKQYIACRELVP